MCSANVSSSCSSSGIRRGILVTILVASHEWGRDIMTNGTNMW
jgi:hypothetical protein